MAFFRATADRRRAMPALIVFVARARDNTAARMLALRFALARRFSNFDKARLYSSPERHFGGFPLVRRP
jgi:hypothetical protein